MLRGTRLSARALMPRMRAQELIANNLANVQTDGYRRERFAFQEVLAETSAADANTRVSVRADLGGGALDATDAPLDVALDGPGFFVLSTTAGERYTRAGHFAENAAGQLVTPHGDRVQGEGGDITLPAGTAEIALDGTIRVNGQVVDRLKVVALDPAALVREGENVFALDPSRAPGPRPVETRVAQGHVESSNVEGVVELVQMMQVFREFETNHRAMSAAGETLGSLIDQLKS